MLRKIFLHKRMKTLNVHCHSEPFVAKNLWNVDENRNSRVDFSRPINNGHSEGETRRICEKLLKTDTSACLSLRSQ